MHSVKCIGVIESKTAFKYMISYMSAIQKESLSLIIFEIFEKKAHLTFDLKPRSKVITPNESPYMTSYMSTTKKELYLS